MKITAPLLLLLACAGVSAADPANVGIQSRELARPEGARHFLLVTPDASAAGLHPLVILLHGHTGTARQLLGQGIGAAPLSAWIDIAARDGVILVAPDGARGDDHQQGWNDCRADAAGNPSTDDAGFIAALIDEAVAQDRADPARVYAMGMSNGGMMTFRLATEMPQRIAAIAAVGASVAAKSECPAPSVPTSVLMIAGDADPLVPYDGGDVGLGARKTRGSVVGVDAAAQLWRRLAKLPAAPSSTVAIAHRDDSDATRAQRTVWGADPKHLQVQLVRITGGGHVEPSVAHRIGPLYGRIVGAQNGDFEAAEEAWAFFRDKTRPR